MNALRMQVVLDPAFWALHSLSLLSLPHEHVPSSLSNIAVQLSADQREFNGLVSVAFVPALLADEPSASMDVFLAALSQLQPADFRQRYLRRLGHYTSTVPALMLDSVVEYAKALQALPLLAAPTTQQLALAHALLQDPVILQARLLAHIKFMWNHALAVEWTHVAATLAAVVAAQQPYMLVDSQLQAVLRARINANSQSATNSLSRQEDTSTVYVQPFPYKFMAPVWMWADQNMWVAVADQDQQATARSRPVSRMELLARLNAIADDTRLKILALLSDGQELAAQTIISELGIPQSSASRHLNQLRAAGFVVERRLGGPKKVYRLVPNHVEATYHVLQLAIAGHLNEDKAPSPAVSAVPVALQRFCNIHGALVVWPSKHKDRMAALDYLTKDFELGTMYTEAQVNAILKRHPGTDHVNLRRYLCDYGFLQRESDGSAYWRVE